MPHGLGRHIRRGGDRVADEPESRHRVFVGEMTLAGLRRRDIDFERARGLPVRSASRAPAEPGIPRPELERESVRWPWITTRSPRFATTSSSGSKNVTCWARTPSSYSSGPMVGPSTRTRSRRCSTSIARGWLAADQARRPPLVRDGGAPGWCSSQGDQRAPGPRDGSVHAADIRARNSRFGQEAANSVAALSLGEKGRTDGAVRISVRT